MQYSEFPGIREFVSPQNDDSSIFECAYYERTSNWGRRTHEHDFVQIFTVTKGEVIIAIDNKEYILSEGMASILPAHIAHSIYSPNGYAQIGCNFFTDGPSTLGIGRQLKDIKTITIVKYSSYCKRVKECIGLLSNPTQLNAIKTHLFFYEYIIELLESVRYAGVERFDIRVSEYIINNLGNKICVEDVAEYFMYSPTHIQRLCRKHYGMSFLSLVHQYRINKAKVLLMNSGFCIFDIARQVGFEEASNFSNFFLKSEGITPKQFRSKHCIDENEKKNFVLRKVETMNITPLIEKIHRVVDSHKLADGQYSRYLWNDSEGNRKMGLNEYGCADAANILYCIGDFPRDFEERKEWVRVLQEMQNPQTGLFYEGTHHTIHTTAHCIAALELFDVLPKHPLTDLLPLLDRNKLYDFLDKLDWASNPWSQSHQGAGLFAALSITRSCSLEWKNDYFAWLTKYNNPETGLGVIGHDGPAPLCHQLYGWFHYFFNHEYAHMPIPNPDKLIDSCLMMYEKNMLTEKFGKEVGFMEIDWIFALNRASRQTSHRFKEVKMALWDLAQNLIGYLEQLDEGKDEGINDLHMLFGAVCALAELQIALPGKIQSEVPMKSVLDRRPFI